MISILSILAFAYVAIVLLMYLMQDKLLYRTGAAPIAPDQTSVADMAIVALPTQDGLEISGWYKGAAEAGFPTIVYFHGNAGTNADRAYKARAFLDAGYGVLLVEYRGFAGNPGKPSEQGLFLDAQAGTDFLKSQGILPQKMVLYGESLGSGVAVAEAARLAERGDPASGVILEAPYTTIPAVAQNHYPYLPAKWLVRDQFDSLGRITKIKAPLLVFHGDRDRVIPQAFGRKLFSAAQEPKTSLWIAGGGHTSIFEEGGAEAVFEFLDSLKKR